MTSAIRKLVDNFTEADIDDEIIIMRLDTGELLGLDGTSAEIWRLIDGARDREELIGALASNYEMGRRQLAHDVGEFLDQLKDAGLIAVE